MHYEKIGYMIREAQYEERVPYMLVIGEKEANDGVISVRNRDSGKTELISVEGFINEIKQQINNRG